MGTAKRPETEEPTTELLRTLKRGAESLLTTAATTTLFPPPLSRRGAFRFVERTARESGNAWTNVGGYFNATAGYLTNAIEKNERR